MKSFERLVEDKNRVIKDCDNFIKELKDISFRTNNISILIKLLSAKKGKYLELKYDNYKESALSVENLDEKIYRQIVILEKQGIFETSESRKKSNKLLKLKNILEELETADIKKYDNYSNEVRDIYDVVSDGNILTLAELLDIDIKQCKEAIYQSYETKISEQLILIKQKYGDKFKESSMYVAEGKKLKIILDKFSTEYKDQGKLKFLLEKANFIKNHYKSLIALLGLTPFIIYFVLNKNIGYIPMPESGDIFSLLVSLALAGLSLLFILYIMPIVQIGIIFCMRDIKGILPVFIFSILLSAALIKLMLSDTSWVSKNSELGFIVFYIFDVFAIYIGLCVKTEMNKLMLFKSEQFWLLAFHGFISILSPFVIFLLVYSRVSNDSIENIVIVSIFILLAIILLFFLLLEKDLYYFAFWFYAFTAINLIIVCLISGKVIQISGLGNIQYKYLIVEKSIKDTLPVEICNKDCNISKTYYNEAGNVIKIYNIKALSTLGKFYYLEADSNTTDKKVKFKLDASKITPGPTLER